MKLPHIALVCIMLLGAGCILVPSPYSDQLKPVVKRYSSIESGTPRSDVELYLGKPSREEKDGPCVWETRFDDVNYVLMRVWFDHDDRAQKVEVTRAHGKIVPGHYATAVTIRSR